MRMSDEPAHCFAYYCSGHGYGHATRVSAFATHLLSLDPKPTIHIVSSAPEHVFADSIARGALYRHAVIDPVIVQPLAYRVDRQKSVDVLRSFLRLKESKLLQEVQWLKEIGANCVLSDAAFLGCLAAHRAGLPSVLITNFTFDSVYSYLSTSMIDSVSSPQAYEVDAPPLYADPFTSDTPIPLEELAPLVDQIFHGYRYADLLLRLPGAIPIPAFAITPGLPASDWVNPDSRKFTAAVTAHLLDTPSAYILYPSLNSAPHRPRTVVSAPLLVRPPNPSVYTSAGRRRLLASIGIPEDLHDPENTKILIVSFGGQVFHKPRSRVPSAVTTPGVLGKAPGALRPFAKPANSDSYFPDADALANALQHASLHSQGTHFAGALSTLPAPRPLTLARPRAETVRVPAVPRAFGRPRALSQLNIAGAPRAAVPTSPPRPPPPPRFSAVVDPPTPERSPSAAFDAVAEDEEEPLLLPDATWIAIVCGVAQGWGTEGGETLPDAFFVAPRDVYMPDLTAAADVLLGKLGYGTVAECVDACTPFVYVPRPLFVEEHGLRLLLDCEGVGVELSRTSYEVGEWAGAVNEAWAKGRDAKRLKRREGETGKRTKEGRAMAQDVVNWVRRWQTEGENVLSDS
ncbi:hypothetical protein B0H21DRAFT_791976 [Amylocystis lapponica]|nr:hypothetical protein B0H21DRAFT_791976 [Amylocystis lapponica]